MNIHKNLKKIRLDKNFTQEYLANELGISQAAYGKIENGQTTISAERLVKLSEVLEVDIAEFLSRESIKYINNKEHNGDIGLVINKNALELHNNSSLLKTK